MAPQAPLREAERANYDFFLDLPELARTEVARLDHKGSQFLEPLFEYSGRLHGLRRDALPQAAHPALRRPPAHRQRHRLLFDLRRQPAHDALHHEPRRPRAGLVELALRGQRGVRLRLPPGPRRARGRRARPGRAAGAADRRRPRHGAPGRRPGRRGGIAAQRERVLALRRSSPTLEDARGAAARVPGRLPREEERLARGRRRLGLRHRLRRARPRAGRAGATSTCSCSTPRSTPTPAASRPRRRRSGAAAKFAAAGKPVGKKDLGLLATMYGHVYVARVAFGAKMAQTAQAFLEAEAYPGPSLIIAYSHCIAHGYDMAQGVAQQKLAVDSGVWPLYRFDPKRARQGRAAAPSRLRATQGQGRRLHAQRVALPHDRARRPRALQDASSRTRRRRPGAATPSISSSRGSPCPCRAPPSDDIAGSEAAGEGGRNESRHDVIWACACRTR